MLTSDDITAIKNLINEANQPLKQDINVLKQDVKTLKQNIDILKSDVNTLKKDVAILKKDVRKMKRDIATINKKINTIIALFDRDYMHIRKRVDRIETHLNLPPLA
ncbi:MAG TPA: hypothetical protein VJH96_02885 [Patescibacteria group bacterium]|nr:hypothetical protein [Patescibacteria group bacterium]